MAGIKYITDENGKKTSVLVPLKTWEDLNVNYSKLQGKLDVFKSVEQGFAEIKQAKKTGKKLTTLKEFLR